MCSSSVAQCIEQPPTPCARRSRDPVCPSGCPSLQAFQGQGNLDISQSWSAQNGKHPYLLGKREVRRSFAQRRKREALGLVPMTTSNTEWKYVLEMTRKMRVGNSQMCL